MRNLQMSNAMSLHVTANTGFFVKGKFHLEWGSKIQTERCLYYIMKPIVEVDLKFVLILQCLFLESLSSVGNKNLLTCS